MNRHERRRVRATAPKRARNQAQVHCALDVRSTTEDLHAYIHRYGPEVVAERYAPIRVSVDGYAHDPRELWEIPEVVSLCQRVIDSGLLSLLSCDTDPKLHGWSAIEVCACAFGYFAPLRGDLPGLGGVLKLSAAQIQRIQHTTYASNAICDAVLAPRVA